MLKGVDKGLMEPIGVVVLNMDQCLISSGIACNNTYIKIVTVRMVVHGGSG